jgi:hypothetical protein
MWIASEVGPVDARGGLLLIVLCACGEPSWRIEGDRVLLAELSPGGEIRDVRLLGPGRATVDGELAPGLGLIATSAGRVTRIDRTGLSHSIELGRTLTHLSGGRGVAWVGGGSELFRVAVQSDGLVSESWTEALERLPSQSEVGREIAGLCAIAPDRAWIRLLERPVGPWAELEYAQLAEVTPGPDAPTL